MKAAENTADGFPARFGGGERPAGATAAPGEAQACGGGWQGSARPGGGGEGGTGQAGYRPAALKAGGHWSAEMYFATAALAEG